MPPRDEFIRFFDSGPGLKFSRTSRVYRALIRRSHENITLSMAYFIPVGQVYRALLRARRRNVEIRVIVPGQSDVKLAQYASEYLYNKLLKRGFAIYERTGQMLHSKVMAVDGQWSVVGSANLDPRSLRINLEFLAAIRSRPFAQAILDICRYEQQHSIRVTSDTCTTPAGSGGCSELSPGPSAGGCKSPAAKPSALAYPPGLTVTDPVNSWPVSAL